MQSGHSLTAKICFNLREIIYAQKIKQRRNYYAIYTRKNIINVNVNSLNFRAIYAFYILENKNRHNDFKITPLYISLKLKAQDQDFLYI